MRAKEKLLLLYWRCALATANLEQFAEKVGGETHTSNYAYDRDNRVTAIQYDGGAQKVSYAYDAIGRVSSRVAECGADAGKLTSSYEYVSYTHLDVYKRQNLHLPPQSPRRCCGNH